MFNVSLGELIVIGIVALIVIGPEQLPATARVIGRWIGRCKHTLSLIRQDFIEERGAKDDHHASSRDSKHV